MGLCFSSWASRIPDIKKMLGLNDVTWGTILLMIPIGQFCGMALSGLVISRLGSKRILPISLLGYAITLFSVSLSENKYSLIISLVAFGFFGNFCNISINTQAITLEKQYNKPIMSSFHGGWSLAGLIGAAFGLLMSTLYLTPIYHFAIITIAIISVLMTNKKYLQKDIRHEKEQSTEMRNKKIRPEKFLYLLGLIAFCGMAAEGGMADWSGLYFVDVVGAPQSLSPIALASYMITMSTGRFFVDTATIKWGARKVLMIGGTCITMGLFLSVLMPSYITSIIGFMIIGLGTAGIVPTIYSIAGKNSSIPTSVALTIVSSISFLGFLLGPPVIGYVSSILDLRYSYAIIGLLGICIIALVYKMKILNRSHNNISEP